MHFRIILSFNSMVVIRIIIIFNVVACWLLYVYQIRYVLILGSSKDTWDELPRLQAIVSVEFCVQTEECILMTVYFKRQKLFYFVWGFVLFTVFLCGTVFILRMWALSSDNLCIMQRKTLQGIILSFIKKFAALSWQFSFSASWVGREGQFIGGKLH